ncbi:MAG: hypothetical protein U1E27_03210, partial [Kiritimatiellia bacterium]|nr:hypothetical protein [Kiritimatiellia bacterium]
MNPICRWPFPVLSFITLAGAAACALASGLPIPEARPAADPSASCGPDSSLPVLEAAGWDPDPAADEKLLADPAANLLTNGGFESVTDGHLSGWRYELRDGAEGSVEFDRSFTRSGAQSLKVTKTNGKGYILVYPEIPIPAKPGDKLSFQGFYHTRDNRSPHQTLGMVRLIQKKDDFTYDQSVDRWLASESQQGLINGRAGQWQKRLGNMEVQAGRSPEVTPCLLIYGNPVTVWWDDFAVEPLAVVSRRYNRAYPRSIELWADETLTDEELDARLAAERDHTARLQPVHGRTVLFVDDEPAAPVVFKNSTYAPQKFRGGELDRVGVRLHMQYISFGTAPRRYPPLEPGKENRGSHPGIVRDKDVYDIDSALDLVRHAMRSSPDSLLLLDLHMHSYDRFVDDHPEEAWRNEAGEPAFGTQAHLLGFSHTLPEGRYRWASFFSPQWQADLEKALTLFLSRLRETDMARRVVGFQITGGHDSQFTYRQLDYSPPAIAAFRNYLRRLYGTDEALAQAWNREVTFETAGVPVILRETDRFLDPASQRDWYDYWRFVQHEIFALQERLARTAKALLAKEVVAIRYQQGTFMGSYAGAYYLNQFFHSDVFDIAAPQPQYPRRRPGVSAANNKAYESHHWNNKLLFKEFDFRTLYFDRGVSEMDDVRLSKATSLNMWEVINRRLVGELMARDHGY